MFVWSINARINNDINKTNAPKERNISHYWYFLDKAFKYEPYLCNSCHDLMQNAVNFNDLAVVSINGSDYWIHFWYMCKDDITNIMNNSNINKKEGHCNFSLYISIYLYIYISISIYIYIYI